MRKRRRDAPRLDNAEEDREITRDLGELLTTVLAFLLELAQRRNDGRQELNHDLRGNVRPDRERTDRALANRAAREDFEPADETAATGVLRRALDDLAENRPIHARSRDLGNESAHEHETEGNHDFLTKFRNVEHVRKALHHRHNCIYSLIFNKCSCIVSKITRLFQGRGESPFPSGNRVCHGPPCRGRHPSPP